MGKITYDLDGAVRVSVSWSTRPASVRGARPVPIIHTLFVGVDGAAVRTSSTLTAAAATLSALVEHIRAIVPDLGATAASDAAAASASTAVELDPAATVEIEGLVEVAIAYRGLDKRGRPKLQVFSVPVAREGELPLLVAVPKHPSQGYLPMLPMDVWAAAEYRDQLREVLESLLPSRGSDPDETLIVGTVDLA